MPQALVPRLLVNRGTEVHVGLHLRNKFLGVLQTVLPHQRLVFAELGKDRLDLFLGVALTGGEFSVRHAHHAQSSGVGHLVDDVLVRNLCRADENSVICRIKRCRRILAFGLQIRVNPNFGAHNQRAQLTSALANQVVSAFHCQSVQRVQQTPVHDCFAHSGVGLGPRGRGVHHRHKVFVNSRRQPARCHRFRFIKKALNGFLLCLLCSFNLRSFVQGFSLCVRVVGPVCTLLRKLQLVVSKLFGDVGFGVTDVLFSLSNGSQRVLQGNTFGNQLRRRTQPHEAFAFGQHVPDLLIGHVTRQRGKLFCPLLFSRSIFCTSNLVLLNVQADSVCSFLRQPGSAKLSNPGLHDGFATTTNVTNRRTFTAGG